MFSTEQDRIKMLDIIDRACRRLETKGDIDNLTKLFLLLSMVPLSTNGGGLICK